MKQNCFGAYGIGVDGLGWRLRVRDWVSVRIGDWMRVRIE